ncbi:MAG: glucosamine-6-phosphate deaminase [Fidelibacterota bacterium]|nr:MAG: glucosamine-6-phosphate deaminase [Candidatus Neomarinimicrobiota bacterium]
MRKTSIEKSLLEARLKSQGFFRCYDDERIPVIEVDSFPNLGRLVALRFIEWIQLNPEGVVSLPTGKTPEYFIRWMNHILENWSRSDVRQLREEYDIPHQRPEFSRLHFVQIDDFFPMPPDHPNSFIAYIKRHYLLPFGFNTSRALLMDFEHMKWPNDLTVDDIFPSQFIDLSLRTRTPNNEREHIQREAIFTLDTFAQEYEQRIRDLGGIGFFLGGIGPDGHIAFNVRGSDFFSTTRLTYTNFETQAVSAADLGGIEISEKKAVMTIGLGTITYNPDVVAIVMAAGEAKASILSDAISQPAGIINPCSVLQRVPNARIYLTSGAAVRLHQRRLAKFDQDPSYNDDDIVRSVMDVSLKHDTAIAELKKAQLSKDPLCTAIMEARNWKMDELKEAARQLVQSRLAKGAEALQDRRFLHTGPHHDDILLGYLPSIIHQIRSATTQHHFAIMTSGFTSVSNNYVQKVVQQALEYLDHWDFQRKWEAGFFTQSEQQLRVKDTFRFLNGVVSQNEDIQRRCISRRVIRAVMDIYEREDLGGLRESLRYILKDIQHRYPGQKDPKDIQRLKGTMREFEEDLAWAHFGFGADYVHHLRLAFYKGEYFTEEPTEIEDLPPIQELFAQVKPDILTLAFDPEASGPDTHYKILQAITAQLSKLPPKGREDLEIWGYRNVWHRFHPGDANMYVPVSINSLGTLDRIFKSCYLTQRDASFPSHEHAGPFSELVQRIFVEQFHMLRTALGPDFFYQHETPRLRGTHGILFMRSMSYEELKASARSLRESVGRT